MLYVFSRRVVNFVATNQKGKEMTPRTLQKLSEARAYKLEWDKPETMFTELWAQANDAWGTDEGNVLEAVISLFEKRERAAKDKHDKLVSDLYALGLQDFDTGSAQENMDSNIVPGTIIYCQEYFRHFCNSIACAAEDAGVDINSKLGYAIY